MWILDRLFRNIVRDGLLTVIYVGGKRRVYGQASPVLPSATIRLTDKATAWRIAINPALGLGEAFMDGRLVVEEGDISDFLTLITHNVRWDKDNPYQAKVWTQRRFAAWLSQFNWEKRSRRNVAHHYDLSGRLYDLFLDRDRQYSCAYFTSTDNSLEQAQIDKKAHIAAKLGLSPGQRVLDIGCGWGGMALYLNKVAGVEVLGITLSEEQLKVARQRAVDAGVADQVRFESIDYRSLTGSFDRIVSVGMFEHVGLPYFKAFFDKCHELLKPDGIMLIHTIGRVDGPGPMDSWTAKYIFPGAYVPALSQIVPAIERAWLRVTDIEVLRLHYAYTLDAWYDRTKAAKNEIVALYDERFYRMWAFFLARSASVFRNGGRINYQIQLTKKCDALPITRDYISASEAAYGES